MPSTAERLTALRSRASAAVGRLAASVAPAISSVMPFGIGQQPPANVPPTAWSADQPPPAPSPPKFDRAYHGHTFRSFSAPLGFGGWTVDRMRAAIETHDQGLFLESSTLAIACTRFGPVTAALGQRIAPALALPRFINGGTRSLAKVLRDGVEAQLCPRAGLLPSPYFPPGLWGSASIDLATMNFAVLQHVYGDEDPVTGVRPIYTRRWPTWATQYYRYRRTYVALTTEGPVDIISGDGKFTLIADEEEPHLNAAVRALGTEVLDGRLAQQARANYIDLYGNPKLVGTMPEKVAVRSPEGDAYFDAMQDVRNPDGLIVQPYGSKLEFVAVSADTSTVFKDALDSVWMYVAAILLGSDGTMTRGTGVYSAPIFAGVRRDLIARMLAALVRGVNQGHVAPWLAFNYAESIAQQIARGLWLDPVLDIPLPDPDADARIKSYAERMQALVAQVKAEREAGFLVTQERIAQIAAALDVEAPQLAPTTTSAGEIFEYHIVNKIVAPDQVLARLGLPPLPDGIGSPEQLAKERAEGKDKAGAGAKQPTGWAAQEGGEAEAQGPAGLASDATSRRESEGSEATV